jgi:IS605 OrfB family transposase
MKRTNHNKSYELSGAQMDFTELSDGVLKIKSWKKSSKLIISKKMIKKIKTLEIDNKSNCDIVYYKGEYLLNIPIKLRSIPVLKDQKDIIGGDLGILKILTTYNSNGIITEYSHNRELLRRLNNKIFLLQNLKKRIRKKQFNKIEKRKIDYTNELHWKLIDDLLKNNDVIYLGDIKSHNIVKNSKMKYTNREFNDLKLYKFKTRLIYKSYMRGKKVVMVQEHHTSKTCSNCGEMYDVKI